MVRARLGNLGTSVTTTIIAGLILIQILHLWWRTRKGFSDPVVFKREIMNIEQGM